MVRGPPCPSSSKDSSNPASGPGHLVQPFFNRKLCDAKLLVRKIAGGRLPPANGIIQILCNWRLLPAASAKTVNPSKMLGDESQPLRPALTLLSGRLGARQRFFAL